ncbi:hypothetical protein KCU65_g7623, partial [Aureobasidium melanogenum]
MGRYSHQRVTYGISTASAALALGLGFLMLCALKFGLERKLHAGMPVLGTCSLAISAACHADDVVMGLSQNIYKEAYDLNKHLESPSHAIAQKNLDQKMQGLKYGIAGAEAAKIHPATIPRLRQVGKVKKKSHGLRMRDLKHNEDTNPMEQPKSVVEVPFSYPSYKLTSKAPLPTCPETCKVCSEHYLPSFSVSHPLNPRDMIPHSDAQAAQITADYVKSIKDDRDAIRAKLKMQGDLLLKRWQKKSVDKRAATVRTAMPDAQARRFQSARLLFNNKRAFEQHYSTISIKKFKARGAEQCMADSMQALRIHNDSHRKQHLLPFIDIETLSQDNMSLLALLHYRSEFDIDDWVMHDFEHLRVGFNWTMGPPTFNPHCVIMYGKHFGRLIPWNQQSAHRYDIIGYPRAVLILEAQATLFAFVRKTVEILLEPSDQGATIGHQQGDTLVQSDFGTLDPKSLVSRRLEAFRSPPQLDMAAIVESLAFQVDILFDELWLQQTDPLYFRAHLAQARDSELHDRMAKEWREEWVLDFALCYSIWADNFQTALLQALSVFEMQEELDGDVCPGKSLPIEYEGTLVLFQRHLEQLFQGQLYDLRCLVPQEKAFRNDFDHVLLHTEPKTKLTSEKLLLANPMLWNLIELYRKNDSHSPTFHLAFVDYLMSQDAKNEKSRISPLLATHISCMITVDDILSSLRYHRPQPGASVDEAMLARFGAEQPRTLPNRHQSALGRIYGLKDAMWPKLQTFMELPLPPSEEPAVLLKHLRPLDEASHEFWRWVHVAFDLAIKHSDRPEKELYSNLWYLTMIGTSRIETRRTALGYAMLGKAAKEHENRKPMHAAQPSNTPIVVTPFQTTWGEPSAPSAVPLTGTKSKKKTRPSNPSTSSTDDKTQDAELVASPPSPQASSIVVSPKSLILLMHMFTADPSAPGEIYWTDFVSAMADAGCSVMPGGGSCFTFTHVDEKEQKYSMVFHRPHPEPSMSKERLRSFGSRLNRHWDWNEATFANSLGYSESMPPFDDKGFNVVQLFNDGWSTDEEATATCFCGAVQLVLPLQKPGLVNRHICHCTDCRKIGSAFYQSNITVSDPYLKYTRGEDNLTTFSEDKTIRAGALMTNYFCKTCGTLMYRRGEQFPGMTILRTGTIDDLALAETKLRPQVEQFIERRVAWSVPIEGAAQVVGMHRPEDIENIA